MKIILKTDRLLLRELNVGDAENFYNLNLNPNVVKYTGDAAINSVEEARLFLENYHEYKQNGYGRWAVMHKETNQFIGWCGLKFDPEENETDIGFRFFEAMWNRGYATESAKACVGYGFETLKLKRIIGRAMKANVASIKVLEKIGLEYERDTVFEGKDAVIYKIEKSS